MMRHHQQHNEYDRVRSDDDDDDRPSDEDNNNDESGGGARRGSSSVRGGQEDQEAPSTSFFSSSSNNSILLQEDEDVLGVDSRVIPRGSGNYPRSFFATTTTLHHPSSWLVRLVIVATASVVAAVLTLSWWAGRRPNTTTATPYSMLDCSSSSPIRGGNKEINTLNDDNNEWFDNHPRPHLHTLISDFQTQITGNVSWLLDFAILGHSKCSTTTHLKWLRTHPDIYMPTHEVHSLYWGRPAEMVSLLYALPYWHGHTTKRGYKNPLDIMSPQALQLLRTHWPETKLVVGVRHPVKWFESYYNFNKRQHDRGAPGATRLGPAELMSVPRHAYFHRHLHLLGKSNGTTDPDEHELLVAGDDGEPEKGRTVPVPPPPPPPPYMSNKVFLYESTQPFDVHEGRSTQYRVDLAAFLDLSSPLPPIPLQGASDGASYYNYTSDTYHYDIDVCDDKYTALRRELVAVGTSAAEWILRYFVVHPDVTVSSPRRFEELLRQWSVDPCEEDG